MFEIDIKNGAKILNVKKLFLESVNLEIVILSRFRSIPPSSLNCLNREFDRATSFNLTIDFAEKDDISKSLE